MLAHGGTYPVYLTLTFPWIFPKQGFLRCGFLIAPTLLVQGLCSSLDLQTWILLSQCGLRLSVPNHYHFQGTTTLYPHKLLPCLEGQSWDCCVNQISPYLSRDNSSAATSAKPLAVFSTKGIQHFPIQPALTLIYKLAGC